MNKFQKSLLGMASLLALTAGQKSAEAALPPGDKGAATKVNVAAYSAYADPLFDLMKRTNGSLKPQAVERALRQMLANPSTAQIESTPTLLAGLAGLGAPSDTVTKSKDVLIQLVSKADNIADEVREAAESKLRQTTTQNIQLAENQPGVKHHHGPKTIGSIKHKRPKTVERLRRPPTVEHIPVPPETGQVPQGAPYSDIRLKENIALLDRLENGLGIYRFSYIGRDQVYVGVMAQEVEAVMPEAVFRDANGYRRVRYDMLGTRMQTWEEWTASGQTMQ